MRSDAIKWMRFCVRKLDLHELPHVEVSLRGVERVELAARRLRRSEMVSQRSQVRASRIDDGRRSTESEIAACR